ARTIESSRNRGPRLTNGLHFVEPREIFTGRGKIRKISFGLKPKTFLPSFFLLLFFNVTDGQAQGEQDGEQKLRRGGDRGRSWRLLVRDSARPTQAESGVHRERRGWWGLPQLGLHTFQGAHRCVPLVRKGAACGDDGHQGVESRARRRRDAGLEGWHRQ